MLKLFRIIIDGRLRYILMQQFYSRYAVIPDFLFN